MLRRGLFLVIGTLLLWYLGHFALNALLMAFAPDLPGRYSRLLDLGLIPLGAAVTWVILLRLSPPSREGEEGRDGPPGA